MSEFPLQVIRILKELKQKYPDKELDQLVELANYYALLHQQKSRAFYRIQVTSKHTYCAVNYMCPALLVKYTNLFEQHNDWDWEWLQLEDVPGSHKAAVHCGLEMN